MKKNHLNGHVATTVIPLLSHGNAMTTTLQHDSDDESSDDDSADSHEDSTEGKEKMKRRRNLLHRHLLKTKSALKARRNFADHEIVSSCRRYIMWCTGKGGEFFINKERIE